MTHDRIDFISEYCDRWCERCAYTLRCSTFAVSVATAMYDDVSEGLELAVGMPQPVDGEEHDLESTVETDLVDFVATAEEVADTMRVEEARRERIEGTAIMTTARRLGEISHPWFTRRFDSLRAVADPLIAEALEIATRDSLFIAAKLHRALSGRARAEEEGSGDGHRIQNDWNGSAKVALISLERSEAAWLLLAQATLEDVPARAAECVAELRQLVLADFSQAMSFTRPGFDGPGR
jgi:hypothetical protein